MVQDRKTTAVVDTVSFKVMVMDMDMVISASRHRQHEEFPR
jgi:hypothetical protein